MALSEIKIKLSVEADIEGDALRIHEMINDQRVKTSVYFLQEQAIRDSLIKLGWTPPREDNCYE